MQLRTFRGWALFVNAILGLTNIVNIVTEGNTSLLVLNELLILLFLFGLPAIGQLQPQTGRLSQVGLWCLGIAAGMAFAVMLVLLFSTVEVNPLIPLSSALLFLLGSVVIGVVTIRARVFPAWLGWLLMVEGVLNLVGGLVPAGLVATLLGVTTVLAQTIAFASYGWIIIRSPVPRSGTEQPSITQGSSLLTP